SARRVEIHEPCKAHTSARIDESRARQTSRRDEGTVALRQMPESAVSSGETALCPSRSPHWKAGQPRPRKMRVSRNRRRIAVSNAPVDLLSETKAASVLGTAHRDEEATDLVMYGSATGIEGHIYQAWATTKW